MSPRALMAAEMPLVSRGAVTDLLLLRHGARDLIRLSCAEHQADAVVASCERMGCAAQRWRGAVAPAQSCNSGEFVLSSRPVERAGADARTFVFVGMSPRLVQAAAGCVADDVVTGAMLGYPACCVDAYLANVTHHLTRLEPAFRADPAEALPFWSNSPLDAYGWHLLSHFPCSPRCAQSRDMALAHFGALARIDLDFAVELLAVLRTVVMAGPDGIAYGREEGGLFHRIGGALAWSSAGTLRFDFTGNA